MPFDRHIPVVQEDMTGCSIACISWMSGKTYAEIKVLATQLGISVMDPRLWSDTEYVRSILHISGFKAGQEKRCFEDWKTMPKYALLAVKVHLENGISHWHWVVGVNNEEGQFVMDPKKSLKNNIRTDFGRMKPHWYIEISPPVGELFCCDAES